MALVIVYRWRSKLATPVVLAAAATPCEMLDALSTSGLLHAVEISRERPLPWPLDDARDDLQRMLGKVIRHRQKGADLVWEAYNVDIGGPE